MIVIRSGSKEVKTEIRAGYDSLPRVTADPEGESRTKQSFQEETNINNIIKKYDMETMAEQALQNPGRFLDLPDGLDYQHALNLSINAKAAFDALPGTIRALFQNNAENFLEFMDDPENEKEIIELGLREPAEVETIEPTATGGEVAEPVANIEPSDT